MKRYWRTGGRRPVVVELVSCFGLVLTGCAGQPVGESKLEPVTIDFESSEVGRAPKDFTTELTGGGGPIAWVVREDSAAPSGKKVVVQESVDDTSYRFPLCVYDKAVATDVSVSVKFKSISGKVDQAAGLVLRYNPENYYIARANSLEDNVNIFKTVNGKRTLVLEVEQKYAAGEWHTFGFEAKGQHLKVTFDGKPVIETEDATFTGPGKVGLWTKADSVSAFDDLRIEPR